MQLFIVLRILQCIAASDQHFLLGAALRSSHARRA
jgi:hypothetical protein